MYNFKPGDVVRIVKFVRCGEGDEGGALEISLEEVMSDYKPADHIRPGAVGVVVDTSRQADYPIAVRFFAAPTDNLSKFTFHRDELEKIGERSDDL